MVRRSLAVAVLALGCGDHRDQPPAAPPPLARAAAPAIATDVTISGSVIDQVTGRPVADIEVVLRGAAGDVATRTNASGAFSVHGAPGRYRVFVRDERYVSTGIAERVRLDSSPRRELAGAADEGVMLALDAQTDLAGIELTAAPAAELSGIVRDPDGRPLDGAVVRLRTNDRLFAARPVLGTDVAVTNARGRFTLRVPAGAYVLDASHRDFAGVQGDDEVELDAGEKLDMSVTLARGCIITGRVVTSDGAPAPDGAIEVGMAGDFMPGGRIDGSTFRWATLQPRTIAIRAWPWRSPPSLAQIFTCTDGSRYDDIVFRLPDRRPDMSGIVVDAHDHPVPLAYLDIVPLDPIVGGQQERADAAGTWHVYDMPPARYRITASAPGLGIADTMVVAPRQDLHLVLGGTGRIAGTTTDLVTGSLEVAFLHCGPKDQAVLVAHEPRIVPVVGGRFAIDDAPACTLTLAVRWRDRLVETSVVVEPERTSFIEVEAGTPREKTVTGVVRDEAGNPVSGARVTAVLHEREAATARTDANGRYTLQTHSGAQLIAGKGDHVGRSSVGRANVASEQVDLVLDDTGY